MTSIEKSYGQYKEKTIESSKPEELTLMLYNGLIKFIVSAKEDIEAKNLESSHNTLIKCQDIVFEFQYSLNMDYPISNELMLLYDYMYNRLIEANAKKDTAILDEVLEFATELRDTWLEVMRLAKEQKQNDEENNDEQKEIEIVADGASAQLGVNAPKVPSTKAIYSNKLRPVNGSGTAVGVASAGSGTGNGAMAASAGSGAVNGAVVASVGSGAVNGAMAASAGNAAVTAVGNGAPSAGDNIGTGKDTAVEAGIAAVSTGNIVTAGGNGVLVTGVNVSAATIGMQGATVLPGVALGAQAQGGTATLTNSLQSAKSVMNSPFNKMNPLVAAQYSKTAKQKEMAQASISIASE
jgi:flagellar protein FliS